MGRATAIGVLMLLLLAASAWASRKPTPRERTLILEAAARHEATCSDFPVGTCRSYIRISTKGPWAAEYVNPTKGHENLFQGGIASFRRIGPERWRFHSLVQEHQGCGAPRAVQRDLHIFC